MPQNSNENIAKHVAIIMDGNSRWAQNKKLPVKVGHNFGVKNIENIVESAIKLEIKYLTLYAFSAENWDRPSSEVDHLMNLLEEYLKKDVNKLIKNDVKITISGDISKLSSNLQDQIKEVEQKTKNNKTINLIVAFSYGSRQEIINATKLIALALKENKITLDDITQDLFKNYLYVKNIPDPDLLIRTAGDFRLSNFLLWQVAYSELYFSEKFWPDFKEKDLKAAIIDFNKRQRRYGKR